MNISSPTIAAAILGLSLVAVAFIMKPTPTTMGGQNLSPVREVQQNLYGSAQADITIVEFSDVECPFCAQVHPTLKQLVDESNGTINWEYRHLPLSFHHNAEYGALVSECVATNLGNDAFWEYLDIIFANQAQITSAYLDATAVQLGLTSESIAACQADSELLARIAADEAAATALGGSGTPYSVIVFPDGTLRPVSGALPHEQWVALLARS